MRKPQKLVSQWLLKDVFTFQLLGRMSLLGILQRQLTRGHQKDFLLCKGNWRVGGVQFDKEKGLTFK